MISMCQKVGLSETCQENIWWFVVKLYRTKSNENMKTLSYTYNIKYWGGKRMSWTAFESLEPAVGVQVSTSQFMGGGSRGAYLPERFMPSSYIASRSKEVPGPFRKLLIAPRCWGFGFLVVPCFSWSGQQLGVRWVASVLSPWFIYLFILFYLHSVPNCVFQHYVETSDKCLSFFWWR